MPQTYVVKQGDHLLRIARRFGFMTYAPIWDAPENAKLREGRPSANALFPGDILFIPDLAQRMESRAAGATHVFQVRVDSLRLRVAVVDFGFRPVAREQLPLLLGEGVGEPTVDATRALLDAPLKINTTRAELRLAPDVALPVLVGHLDPAVTLSGAQDRLNHLGYQAGSKRDAADPELRSALEEFQCDEGLVATGDLDVTTAISLIRAHGA